MNDSPAIDLVVATVGRTAELSRLLESLERQTYRNFRLILVDQNDDDRLDALLAPHEQTLTMLRLRSQRGLSRARNLGLRSVEGDVVAFPDDDCWYPPHLLQEVCDLLSTRPEWDGVSIRSTDEAGNPSNIRWDSHPGPIDRFNVWRRASSISVFLRRRVIEAVGDFSAELGAGAGTPWASGEETDYLLRVLEAGFRLEYVPSLSVHHEWPRPAFDRAAARAGYESGLGNGLVLALHRYPVWFVAWRVAQLAGASLVFLVTGRPAKARFYSAMALGRATGWRRSK